MVERWKPGAFHFTMAPFLLVWMGGSSHSSWMLQDDWKQVAISVSIKRMLWRFRLYPKNDAFCWGPFCGRDLFHTFPFLPIEGAACAIAA